MIVSEETGTISVAIGGMLKRYLAPETLSRLLMNELITEPEDKPAPKAVRKVLSWLPKRKEDNDARKK